MTSALVFLAGTLFGATLGALAMVTCQSAKKRDKAEPSLPLPPIDLRQVALFKE